MIPLALLPGSAQWGAHLDELLARPEALWLYGAPGCGRTSLAAELAALRGADWLDAAGATEALDWLGGHPRGIVAAPEAAPPTAPCLALRLPSVEEHPEAIPALLAHLAQEEGVTLPLPSALAALPCPGNLRELRNLMERVSILWPADLVLPEAFPARMRPLTATVELGGDHTLDVVSDEHVRRVLARVATQEEAARILGVDPSTLWRMRKRKES